MNEVYLFIFTAIQLEKLPATPHPIQHLAMWQIFNKFLEYFLSFAWPYIPHNTGLFGIYAGVTMMAVIWWSKNSFHSFPLSPIKAFTQGYHSSRHKYPFITRRRTKYFSSMLNIHQKAAEGCLTLSKKACWSQTRLNPQVRIWGSAGDCALYALC